MVDNELLQAISQMMDEKLKPINKELSELKNDQHKLRAYIENILEKKIDIIFETQRVCEQKLA